MPLAIVKSRATLGIQAEPITVEVHVTNGLPRIHIVGLPEKAVKESQHRVRSALMTSLFEFPNRHITVSLAPADLPKDGARFDLPIALGILAASQQIPLAVLADYEFVGELALSGELKPLPGCLPIAMGARAAKHKLILPAANAAEAALVANSEIYPALHLLDVCAHLLNKNCLAPLPTTTPSGIISAPPLLHEIRGQTQAKRALMIAASGGHHLLLMGPPGTGKTLLAKRLPLLLPLLTEQQALEIAAIHSVCGKPFAQNQWRLRAFRTPHHTASQMALTGGGRPPKPGEISLAHHGVLFLDELPEYQRNTLETLREPLENGHITIARAAYQAQYPAQFQLVAAMNPCPCGYFGDEQQECFCTPAQIQHYQQRISGPLRDRIDLHVNTTRVTHAQLSTATPNTDQELLQLVAAARATQLARQAALNVRLNGLETERYCQLTPQAATTMSEAFEKLRLSARRYHRLLRVARTIADLAGSTMIEQAHALEALSFRQKIGTEDRAN